MMTCNFFMALRHTTEPYDFVNINPIEVLRFPDYEPTGRGKLYDGLRDGRVSGRRGRKSGSMEYWNNGRWNIGILVGSEI